MADADLSRVPTTTLEKVLDALTKRHLSTPVHRAALSALNVGDQLDTLQHVLEGHTRQACMAVVQVILAERHKLTRPAPELVWTGPEGQSATARDTAIVLRELFEGARDRVLLAGYSFDHPEKVLAPLYDSMCKHGVEAQFFVNIEQPNAEPANAADYARGHLDAIAAACWPFGSPAPVFHCDKRATRAGGKGIEYVSLHAKCVAVDGKRAFISSANFTDRAQNRNIETGVLIHSSSFASHLERQFLSLVEGNLVFTRG